MRRSSDTTTTDSSDHDDSSDSNGDISETPTDNLPIPVPATTSDRHSSPTNRALQQLTPSQLSGSQAGPSAVRGGQLMNNNPNDERVEVRGAQNVTTPRASLKSENNDLDSPGRPARGGARIVQNLPHDEAIPVTGHDIHVATPMALRGGGGGGAAGRGGGGAMMQPDDDDGDDEDGEEEEEDNGEDHEYRAEGYAGQKPEDMPDTVPEPSSAPVDPQLVYNPAKYARVNATANPAMRDLFALIARYEPFAAELPAKLRPFVPDYIPAIGDLDPFVKIPRPDGEQDGLGLYVIDEPTIPQSNPAVVLLELNATNAHGIAAEVIDSLENAAHRPEVIDRWISDIKKVHYKKALPTVNYQRPMPEIETLMQVWPQQFEEMLNSDVAFPPSHIDLDLDQYVRTLCAVLDIPTYSSLIDSLHVMFTLYEEFCSNQHFQHS